LSLTATTGSSFTVVAGSSVAPYGGEKVSDPGVSIAYITTLVSPAGGHFVDASGHTVYDVTGTDTDVTTALHGWTFVADPLASGRKIDGTVDTTVVEQNGEVSSGRPIYELGVSNYSIITPPAITGTKANADPGAPFAGVAVADDVDQNGASFSKVSATITESVNSQTSDTVKGIGRRPEQAERPELGRRPIAAHARTRGPQAPRYGVLRSPVQARR